MDLEVETAALVALLRSGRRSWSSYATAVETTGSARALLDDEQGLLAETTLAAAAGELDGWRRRHIAVISALDDRYPKNLRRCPERPPLLFVAGELARGDAQAVAVVGTRQPSRRGTQECRAIVHRLATAGVTVVSGLAAGIDTVAHEAVLSHGGRTIAVIGNGLDHCYPRQNAPLQQRIAAHGAVVSQFWPEDRPSRRSFPLRNGVMAGLADASVIVEANAMSGTRIEARLALAAGRSVLLHESLLSQPWARELAEKPGAQVVSSPADVMLALERLHQEELVV